MEREEELERTRRETTAGRGLRCTERAGGERMKGVLVGNLASKEGKLNKGEKETKKTKEKWRKLREGSV